MTDSIQKYPVIERAASERWLSEGFENEDTGDGLSSLIGFRPCTNQYDEELEERLREILLEIQTMHPGQIRKGQGNDIESSAAPMVHKVLRQAPVEALVDPEFWIYLSLQIGKEFIDWRFGFQPTCNNANYGLRAMGEGVLFRLFLRAEIVHDQSLEDPYCYSQLGTMDLWRSHIIRVKYGRCHSIVKGLLLLQSGQLGIGKLSPGATREVAKDLQRIYTNVAFELLDDTESQAIMLELAQRHVAAAG